MQFSIFEHYWEEDGGGRGGGECVFPKFDNNYNSTRALKLVSILRQNFIFELPEICGEGKERGKGEIWKCIKNSTSKCKYSTFQTVLQIRTREARHADRYRWISPPPLCTYLFSSWKFHQNYAARLTFTRYSRVWTEEKFEIAFCLWRRFIGQISKKFHD